MHYRVRLHMACDWPIQCNVLEPHLIHNDVRDAREMMLRGKAAQQDASRAEQQPRVPGRGIVEPDMVAGHATLHACGRESSLESIQGEHDPIYGGYRDTAGLCKAFAVSMPTAAEILSDIYQIIKSCTMYSPLGRFERDPEPSSSTAWTTP